MKFLAEVMISVCLRLQKFFASGFYTESHGGSVSRGNVDAFSPLMRRCWKML